MTQSSITNANPIIRSTVYRLISSGFRYPDPEIFDTFQNGKFLSELWDNISSLPYLDALVNEKALINKKVHDDMEKSTLEDFEVGYVQTFDVGVPEPPCPPYEGVYRKDEVRTSLMIEVSQFYKHFGLSMNQEEGKRELPDHLCAELEFLHFLAFKEAQAREKGDPELLHGYLLAQKDFLERHLVHWMPKFYSKLQSTNAPSFYVQLAGIASLFITYDLERLSSDLHDLDYT